MIYGYARVSTNGQAKDGNSLEAQEIALRENGAKEIFKDKFTGTKSHRPELDKLMSILKNDDILIVTKLDRIARSTQHGIQLINDLLTKNIKVNVLNMGVMDNTPNGKLIRAVFFAFAEFKRDMIVERTSEGKNIARQNPNFKEGRPELDTSSIDKMIESQKQGLITIQEACLELGISRSTWYNRVRGLA